MNVRSVLIMTILIFSLKAFSQKEVNKNAKIVNESKRISLIDALELGLRKNNDQRVRDYTLERIELDWNDDFYDFWFPKLKLTLKSDNHKIQNIASDNSAGPGALKTPQGYFGIEFEDFKIFNWGRDYLSYLNSQTTYNRQKQSLGEKKRLLRFEIIDAYFNLSRLKLILKARKDQLRHTSFIYRLSKEKLGLKKINSQEYLQTKEEFLRAQSEYLSSNNEVISQEQILAKLLGDAPETSYFTSQVLKFKAVTPTASEAMNLALTQSPSFRDAKTNLQNASRSFKKTLKDNLPLPTFSLNLGAFRRNFGQSGMQDNYLSNNSKNVDLRASVNMSWTLFGKEGLFNSRTKERSFIDKRIAEIEFVETKRDIRVKIRNLFRTLRYLERKIETTEIRLQNAKLIFDQTLDNYIANKTTFPNMKLVVDALVNSEIDFQNAKYLHLNKKLELSDLMGLEDLPGENFEKLVLE